MGVEFSMPGGDEKYLQRFCVRTWRKETTWNT